MSQCRENSRCGRRDCNSCYDDCGDEESQRCRHTNFCHICNRCSICACRCKKRCPRCSFNQCICGKSRAIYYDACGNVQFQVYGRPQQCDDVVTTCQKTKLPRGGTMIGCQKKTARGHSIHCQCFECCGRNHSYSVLCGCPSCCGYKSPCPPEECDTPCTTIVTTCSCNSCKKKCDKKCDKKKCQKKCCAKKDECVPSHSSDDDDECTCGKHH